jgi:hypothetical protein
MQKTWEIEETEGEKHVVKAEISSLTGHRSIRVDDELVVKKIGMSGSKHRIDAGDLQLAVHFIDKGVGAEIELERDGSFVPDVQGRVSPEAPAEVSKRSQSAMPAIFGAVFAAVGASTTRFIEGVELADRILIALVLALIGAAIGVGLSRLRKKPE